MNLRELRRRRGLSQRELASKSGVSHISIAQFETGTRSISNMTLGTALKLCDALRVANPRKLLEDSTESLKENKPTE